MTPVDAIDEQMVRLTVLDQMISSCERQIQVAEDTILLLESKSGSLQESLKVFKSERRDLLRLHWVKQ